MLEPYDFDAALNAVPALTLCLYNRYTVPALGREIMQLLGGLRTSTLFNYLLFRLVMFSFFKCKKTFVFDRIRSRNQIEVNPDPQPCIFGLFIFLG
jgi:hypothetical protein